MIVELTIEKTWYVSAQLNISSNLQCLHNQAYSFKCYSMYVSNNLWCCFQQCPLEIGSVWAERVGCGEVGWYIHPKGENSMAVCGFDPSVGSLHKFNGPW